MSRPSRWRVALSAIRPQTLPAAVAPVVVASALAQTHGHRHLPVTLAAMVGAVLIQIFANLYNDLADFRRGADTDDRLGPARVTQRGWMTERQVLMACGVTVAGALAVGVYLATVGGWPSSPWAWSAWCSPISTPEVPHRLRIPAQRTCSSMPSLARLQWGRRTGSSLERFIPALTLGLVVGLPTPPFWWSTTCATS